MTISRFLAALTLVFAVGLFLASLFSAAQAQGVVDAVLTDPQTAEYLVNLVATAMMAVFTGIAALLTRAARTYLGERAAEAVASAQRAHREAIERAAESIAAKLVLEGRVAAGQEAAGQLQTALNDGALELRDYLFRNLPTAFDAVRPTLEGLGGMLGRKVADRLQK